MEQPWYVLKFGGSSVATELGWTGILQKTKQKIAQGYRVFIVTSALQNISDLLEKLSQSKCQNQHQELIQRVFEQHDQLASALEIDSNELLSTNKEKINYLSNATLELKDGDLLRYKLQAGLMAQGELMATRLGWAYLQKTLVGDKNDSENNPAQVQWLDARDYLMSEVDDFESPLFYLNSNARINHDFDPTLVNDLKLPIVITQGYIGKHRNGDTVLLGRGGSDVSASIFAARISAEAIDICTDVLGMFSIDPRITPKAKLLHQLNYAEAQEIAATGGNVLHPSCIPPVEARNIPMRICSTFDGSDKAGTLVCKEKIQSKYIKAISVRKSLMLITMETVQMWQQSGFLAWAFDLFNQHNLSIDLISTSESSITVSLNSVDNPLYSYVLEPLLKSLEEKCNVTVIQNCASIALIGNNVHTAFSKIENAIKLIVENPIYMMVQASNCLNFSFVVNEQDADELACQMHQTIVAEDMNSNVFGQSWLEISSPTDIKKEQKVQYDSFWWYGKRDDLTSRFSRQTPCYVYSEAQLETSSAQLKALAAIDNIFYAVKANNHPDILDYFYQQNLGFECVSIEEIRHILKLFPTIERQRILFTPNFAAQEEYAEALTLNARMTLDNLYVLKHWHALFQNRAVFLRLDLGDGHGHHSHVKTGSDHSKFGISLAEIEQVCFLTQKHNIKVIGLHCHIGSGVNDPTLWVNNANQLAKIALQSFPDVEILNLGGGLAVTDDQTTNSVDFEYLDNELVAFKEKHPKFKLWFEPGRYLVATSGVLLGKITQLKTKGDVHYVGVDVGMNSLIRPILYDAYHMIINLSRIEQPLTQRVSVVGNICETGDCFGTYRLFPESEEGDVVLIANAGAYGSVMSSYYNMRTPAREFYLKKK